MLQGDSGDHTGCGDRKPRIGGAEGEDLLVVGGIGNELSDLSVAGGNVEGYNRHAGRLIDIPNLEGDGGAIVRT